METATQDPALEAPTSPEDEPTPPEADGGDDGQGDDDGYPGDLVLEGDGQLSFGVGGKRPTTSSLRLVGGKVDVEGQFEKGERIILHVEAEVREVAFRDEVDGKTGQVVGAERRHKAAITGVERV